MAPEVFHSIRGLFRGGLRRIAAPVRSERFRKTISRIQRTLTPIDDDGLRAALGQIVDARADLMLVHSSLSACGQFTAGPDRVLDTLSDYATTLALVTHSYCYPEQPEELGPVFESRTTPSKNGILTNLFRQRPGTLRSIHATHSLAARGPLANEITAGHYQWDSPTGLGTPYSRMIARKASVLMLGVSFHYYTLFHTAEFEAGSEHAYQHGVTDRLRVVDETGVVRECLSRRQNWAPMRFAEAGELMERKGLVRRLKLGRGFLRFVPDSAKSHDFLIERLRKNPDFLRQSCRVELH
jgi:aminoglycoside 3-N-acetyltransferase